MFHVKHRARPAALALAALALLAAGCVTDVSNPDGWAAPVQYGDLTIAQERRGELVAVRLGGEDNPFTDGADERVAWRFPADGDGLDLEAVYANPILDGDRLYVAGYSGDVVALDLSRDPPGRLWRRELRDRVVATPAFDGRTLYVATEGGELVPIEAASGLAGAPLARAGDRIWSQPALGGGVAYVPALDDRVRAVGAADGGERWTASLSGAVPGDPALGGDLLLVGSFDRRLHALDAATGAEVWTFPGDGWFWARPLVAGDVVYAVSTRGSVYALNLRGAVRERWRFNRLDSEIRAAPVIAGGVLAVAAEEGMIFGLDPATGEERWAAPLPGRRLLADPLVLGSRLIYSTARGDLIEVDARSGRSAVVYERS